MSTSMSSSRVDMGHPYQAIGVLLIVVAFGILAFSLGVLARCGGGTGVCFDIKSHASGDAGLILFVIALIAGVACLAATGSEAIVTTRTRTTEAPAAAPSVTNVFPQPTTPAPVVTNVYPQTGSEPTTPVRVTPPQ